MHHTVRLNVCWGLHAIFVAFQSFPLGLSAGWKMNFPLGTFCPHSSPCRRPPLPNEIMLGQRGIWLPDSYRQISRLLVFGPSGFRHCASATLRCKICYLATLERKEGGREEAMFAQDINPLRPTSFSPSSFQRYILPAWKVTAAASR